MNEKPQKISLAESIYGKSFQEEDAQVKEKRRKEKLKLQRAAKARIILVFSLTVTLLALFCISILPPASAEYIVCLFVLVLNVLLIAAVFFVIKLSKGKKE